MARKKTDETTAAASGMPPAPGVLDGLTIEVVPIDSLVEDPANAMDHPARSIEAIKGSLARFKQQKPIVVDANNVVRAGNGTLRAARELGWTTIAVVRSELSPSELTAFSLADNRVAQHGEWSYEILAGTIRGLKDEGHDVSDLGWADYELDPLLAADWKPPAVADLPDHGDGAGVGIGTGGGKADPVELTADQRDVVDQAVDRVRTLADDGTLTEGQCVMLVCRDYLDRHDHDDVE